MIQIDNYTLNKEEEQVVKSALEVYARIFQGQFSALADMFRANNVGKIPDNALHSISQKLDECQVTLHGDVSRSWRIASNLISRSALKAHRLELLIEGDRDRAEELTNLAGFNSTDHDTLGGLFEKSAE